MLLQNQPSKPKAAGMVFVFGTTQPSNCKILMDVLQWTANSISGNQRRRLLTTQNFDNNRCYQINSGTISIARQKKFLNPIPSQPKSVNK